LRLLAGFIAPNTGTISIDGQVVADNPKFSSNLGNPRNYPARQQQRVALARALVLRPKALLMDEPLSNPDEELNQDLRAELLGLHAQLGFTLLYVTHYRAEAREIGTCIVSMRQGCIERIVPGGGGGNSRNR